MIAESTSMNTGLSAGGLALADLGRRLLPGILMSKRLKKSLADNDGKPIDAVAYEITGAHRFVALVVHGGRRWDVFCASDAAVSRRRARTVKFALVQGLYQAPLKLTQRRGKRRFVPVMRNPRLGLERKVTLYNHRTPLFSIKAAAGVETREAVFDAFDGLFRELRAKLASGDESSRASIRIRGVAGWRARYVLTHQMSGLRKRLLDFVPGAIEGRRAQGLLFSVPANYYALASEDDNTPFVANNMFRRLEGVRRVTAAGETRVGPDPIVVDGREDAAR